MKHKDMMHELYHTIGVLEGLTYCLEIPEAVSIAISDCIDKLEIVGAQFVTKDVNEHETTEAFGQV